MDIISFHNDILLVKIHNGTPNNLNRSDKLKLLDKCNIDIDNRVGCSFFCMFRWTSKNNNIFEFYPVLKSCDKKCKHLIRPDEFTYDTINVLDQLDSNIFLVQHLVTYSKMMMEVFDIKNYDYSIEKYWSKYNYYIVPVLGKLQSEEKIALFTPIYDIRLSKYLIDNAGNISDDDLIVVFNSIAQGLQFYDSEPNLSIIEENIYGIKSRETGKYLWTLGYPKPLFIKDMMQMRPPEYNDDSVNNLDNKADIWQLGKLIERILCNSSKGGVFYSIIDRMTHDVKAARPTIDELQNELKLIALKHKVDVFACRCEIPTARKFITFEKDVLL